MIHKIKKVTRQFFFCLLIVIAIGLSLVRFFLLGVGEYKATIESKIYELTEIPIEIGELHANMRGFNPTIILKDIRVLATDNSEQQPIKLEEMRFSINLIDLIWTQQLLSSSWLTLVGVKLSIERLEDGSLSIIGLNSAKSKQPYWLLKAGRYVVLRSEITWLDKQRHASPLKFDNVDLLLKNDFGSESHEIHLVSQLPDSIGESFRVSMSLQGNVFEKDNIKGLVYIKGNKVQLAKVFTGELPFGLKIATGKGNFELWSQWEKSKNIALTGNIQAKNISIKKQQKVYKLDSLITTFNGSNQPSGWQLGVTGFKVKTSGKQWPATNFIVSANHPLTQLAASVEQLDLQEFSEMVQFFAPLTQENRTLLTHLEVKGQVNNFTGYLNTEKNIFAVNGEFNNIFISSFADFPQIKNLSASIHGSNESGIIGFNTQKASVFFPDIFRKAIPIELITGQLAWQQQADKWLIESEQLVLNVKDAQTTSKLSILVPNNEDSIFMDLQSAILNIEDVSAIPNYYPVSLMTKKVLRWLDNAFVAGKIKQGGLLFSGKLNEYPFTQGQGVFEVLLDASQVELQFAPHWPHLHNVNAEIAFQQGGLIVTSDHAEVHGLNISNTQVEIPHLGKSNYVLVKGRAIGKINNSLKFMQETPLHHTVDKFLDVIDSSGSIRVSLKAKVPLAQWLESKVDGVIKLNKIGLNIKAINLKVSEVNGKLTFTEQGLFAKNIKAKALGGSIDINLDTQQLKTTLKATGTTDILQLQKQFSFFNDELLANNKIKGAFAYQLMLNLPSEKMAKAKLNIATSLRGVTMDLPGKLKKAANEDKQLDLNFLLSDAELLPLNINFNNDIKAAMYIDTQQKQLYSANIIYGDGQASIPKDKTVNVHVNQPSFDITEWLALFGSNGNKQQSNQSIVNTIHIKTENLRWNNQSYGFFDMFLTQNEQKWLGQLHSPVAKGHFVIPFKQSDTDKIKLEMAYIDFSKLIKTKSEKKAREVETDFPLIDIFSEKLLWMGSNLGALEIKTERILGGIRFNSVNIISMDYQLKMSADWVKQGSNSVTTFQGLLASDDMGKVTYKVGLGHDLVEAKGSIEFSGQWPGAPHQFSLEDVEADVDVILKDGRIASIEPGFGRALGFLAMEQWVKRLTLDFTDLYKKGLSFNSITGLFTIEQGAAHTNRLFIDSIPAQIIISGGTDLLTKKLDYNIEVIPKSSGALPIAGTIISGIAGTIVSDFREGYFFGSKYHATGKWGDIKLESLHDQGGVFNRTWAGIKGLFGAGQKTD